MTRTRTTSPARSVLTSGACLALLCGALATTPLRAEQVPVVVIEQVTTGLPKSLQERDAAKGSEAEDEGGTSWQRLVVDLEGKRLKLTEFADAGRQRVKDVYILQSDAEGGGDLVWHFPGGGRRYREIRGDLNERQKNRRIKEDGERRVILQYPPRSRQQALKQSHLRLDGSREVLTKIEPGPQLLGQPTQHLTVTENDRVVISADLIRKVPGESVALDASRARRYFDMYRRLGAFSEEVLTKLEGVQGIPVRAKFTVVTDLPAYTLGVEVSALRALERPASDFTLPPDAELIPDVPLFSSCPVCGKEFETVKGIEIIRSSGTYFACQEKCKVELIRELRKLERKIEAERSKRKATEAGGGESAKTPREPPPK